MQIYKVNPETRLFSHITTSPDGEPVKDALLSPPPDAPDGFFSVGIGHDTRDTQWLSSPECYAFIADGKPDTMQQPKPALRVADDWVAPDGFIVGKPPEANDGFEVMAIDGAWVQVALPVVEPQPQPLDASVSALTPGTDANIVFSWMATLAATNPAVSVARNDINLNLLGLGPLWASNRPMASIGLDVAFGMLWAAVPDAPEGYDAVVAAWRTEYHLTAG